MSNNTVKLLVAGTVMTALGACSSAPVKVDMNPAMSVANCHSYAFADEHTGGGDQAAFSNPLNAERLRQAIAGNMASRGMQLAPDRRSADCVIGYAMGTRQVFDDFYGNYGVGWGWGGGWGGRRGWGGGWGGGAGFGGGGPYAYDETRISVDLFDAKSRIPIWHATVTQTVSDLTGPHAVEKINAATTAIFAKFPHMVMVPGSAT